MVLEQSSFSLRQCLHELLDSQLFQTRQKGLAISIDLPETVPDLLQGDQLRTRQILLNLVGNAIKFTEQGGISISATVVSRQDSRVLIRLDISDTGIGMAPDLLERIFASFEQADNSTTRKYGGSGLGLAICRRLTDLMGGRIWAESTPGAGSSFHLELPFTVLEQQPAPEDSADNVTASSSIGRSLSLLLAEDNRVNAEFIFKVLTRMGHRVTTVENGQLVLEQLAQQSFDAVLMDIQMPGMGGDEAARIIREQEQQRGGHIPIIALTAHVMDDERRRLLEQGFDAHVGKPVEIGVLMTELARLTGQASSNNTRKWP